MERAAWLRPWLLSGEALRKEQQPPPGPALSIGPAVSPLLQGWEPKTEPALQPHNCRLFPQQSLLQAIKACVLPPRPQCSTWRRQSSEGGLGEQSRPHAVRLCQGRLGVKRSPGSGPWKRQLRGRHVHTHTNGRRPWGSGRRSKEFGRIGVEETRLPGVSGGSDSQYQTGPEEEEIVRATQVG